MNLIRHLLLLVLASPLFALAQSWPTQPVRVMVGFPPGGTTDIIGRLTANELSEQLGKPFVVENRGGASGTIGAATPAATMMSASGFSARSTKSRIEKLRNLRGRVHWPAEENPHALVIKLSPTGPASTLRGGPVRRRFFQGGGNASAENQVLPFLSSSVHVPVLFIIACQGRDDDEPRDNR